MEHINSLPIEVRQQMAEIIVEKEWPMYLSTKDLNKQKLVERALYAGRSAVRYITADTDFTCISATNEQWYNFVILNAEKKIETNVAGMRYEYSSDEYFQMFRKHLAKLPASIRQFIAEKMIVENNYYYDIVDMHDLDMDAIFEVAKKVKSRKLYDFLDRIKTAEDAIILYQMVNCL